MKKFVLIEHSADIGLKAYGKTLAEAFANAAYGMFAVIAELDGVREAETRRVELNEDDTESLLFEWLNSLLYLFDV
jgi:SHS2 domain-containing protein